MAKFSGRKGVAAMLLVFGLSGCIHYSDRVSEYERSMKKCTEQNKRMCQEEYEEIFVKQR